MPEPLPERIGKYPITRVLGEGGMGIVFLGRDPGTDRDVAVKTIKADLPDAIKDEIRPRFEREGRVGRLQHDNLVTIYETGEWDGGRPYIAMEFIDGEALDKLTLDLKQAGKKLPLIEQLDIVRQVCEGLDYAHQNEVFHRDIKPANVIRRRDGRAKIVDFGIARVQGSSNVTSLTGPMQVIGTVAYMAPERLKGGRGDGPADIFAAGVMLYYLLTGQEPFTGTEALSVAHKVVSEPYAPLNTHLPQYPPAIDQILELALAKDPADRYSRAQEFAADLAAIINELNRGRIPGLLLDAERLLNEGRWDLAIEKAEEVTRIDPQNLKARELSRKAGRGRRDEADEEKVRASLREAQRFAADGRYDEAIQIFEELVRRRPGSPDFQAQLEEARTRRRDQNTKGSGRAEALNLRAQGDQTGALHRYMELVALYPEDGQLHEEYRRLKKEFDEQEQHAKTERHVENARQAVGAQRYTEAIEIIEGIYKLKIARPDIDRLYQEALKGRKDKDDERYRDQVIGQARKLRSVEQYAEAAAELDQGLLRLPGNTALLKLRSEIDREAKNIQLRGWIAETVERVSQKALSAVDDALIELRESMKQLPGEERFELLEADLVERIEQAEAEQRRSVCLRDGNEALYAGDPDRAIQIVQRYLVRDRSDEEIDRLLREAEARRSERDLERRAAECEAQSQPLIDQGRFTEAIGILQPGHAETKNRRLARLLEEAERRKSEIDAVVRRLAPRILELRQSGKQAEAIALIESQDAVTLRNPDLQKILEVLREEVKRQSALADAVSRSRRALENGDWAKSQEPLDDIRRVFGEFEGHTRALTDYNQLRSTLADQRVSGSIDAAHSAILAGDKNKARKVLEEAAVALPYATASAVQSWERLAKELKVEPTVAAPGSVVGAKPSGLPVWPAAAAVIVVLAAGLLLWKIRAVPPRESGTYVQITKAPPGASVLIEGVAPLQTDSNGQVKVPVKPGHLSVKVSKDGFTSYSDDIDVDKGVTYSVSAKLTDTQTTGTLVVKGNVEKFKLFVDNLEAGGNFKSGDRIQIAKGSHVIHYEADGFERSPDKPVLITKGADMADTFDLKEMANSAVISNFSASPTSVSPDGTEVTLRWRTSNAQKASIDKIGDVLPNGERKVNVAAATTYTLTVVGSDGKSVRRQTPVELMKQGAAFIASFTALPNSAKPGDMVTLSWQTKDATEVSIDQGVGRRGANGSAKVSIPQDARKQFTYQLVASGKGGDAQQTFSVDIIPPPAPPPVAVVAPVAAPVAPPVAIKAPVVAAPAALDPEALGKAIASFESVFTSASGGDKKTCVGAFAKLSPLTSKQTVDNFDEICGAATSFRATHECGNAPQSAADDNTKATWSCNETISFRLKDGGNKSTPVPSTFHLAKNATDGSWKVVKWDPRM